MENKEEIKEEIVMFGLRPLRSLVFRLFKILLFIPLLFIWVKWQLVVKLIFTDLLAIVVVFVIYYIAKQWLMNSKFTDKVIIDELAKEIERKANKPTFKDKLEAKMKEHELSKSHA